MQRRVAALSGRMAAGKVDLGVDAHVSGEGDGVFTVFSRERAERRGVFEDAEIWTESDI